MKKDSKRSVFIIFLIILTGCILGTALSHLIYYIIPEGNVLEFFKLKTQIGFGNNEDWLIDSNILKIKLGFQFDVSILSILGIGISWYFLRYFK